MGAVKGGVTGSATGGLLQRVLQGVIQKHCYRDPASSNAAGGALYGVLQTRGKCVLTARQ